MQVVGTTIFAGGMNRKRPARLLFVTVQSVDVSHDSYQEESLLLLMLYSRPLGALPILACHAIKCDTS